MDNFGWECTTGNWYNNWDANNPASLASAGVTYKYSDNTNWDTFLATLQSGVPVNVYAHLVNGYVVATMSCNGIVTTAYVKVNEGETPFINLSGEACTLTDIKVTYGDRNHYQLQDFSVNWWWGNHSEGILISESPVTVSFTSTTFESATSNWNGPLWAAYTSADSAVGGIGYTEYWVQRADNYGWIGDLNRWSDTAALAAAGITYSSDESNTHWDTFVDTMKAGVNGTITAYLDGTVAVITMDFNGLISTVSLDVGANGPVYLSLFGELNTLSNISVCYHGNTELKDNASATCTADGYTGDTCCADCGLLLESGSVIAASGHTEGQPVTENEVSADCTSGGSYDTVTYCSVCDTEISRVTTTVDASGHTEGQPVTENVVAATCTEDGSYDTVTYCTVCDAEISRKTTTVAAIGHDYGDVTYTWSEDHSTCTAKRVCGNDASHVETTTASITSVSTATCGQDGVITYTATFAAEWATKQTAEVEVKATGEHVYANFVERKEATCTEDGYEIYACGCGAENKTVLTAKGHTAGAPVTEKEVAATCTDKGSHDTVTYCSVCDAELDRTTTVTEANGHTAGTPVTEKEIAATCTDKGSYDTVTYCSVCNAEMDRVTTVTEAKGHTAGTPVTEKEVAATCTDKGSHDTVTYCAVCNAEMDRVTTVTEAKGHTAGAPVTEKEVAATCTDKGSHDTVTYCSVCNAELDRVTTVTEAKGHSYLNGFCSVCSAADPSYVTGTLDCPGWWAAHTEGVLITEDGVTITFDSKTYESAVNNWDAPLYVLYTNDEPVVGTLGVGAYAEYWVQRTDNYGWIGGVNRWSGDDALAAAGIAYTVDETNANWDNFLAALKEGIDVTITAKLVDGKAVVTMDANGVVSTVTAVVDTSKPVYLSLTGENCTLTNIVVTYHQAEPDLPPKTGDSIAVFVALMFASAMGIAIVSKKKF